MYTLKEQTKDDLLKEIDERLNDKAIEPKNAELLKKLIEKADSFDEALMIKNLGTLWCSTGIRFERDFEKAVLSESVCYFKKNEELSFHTDNSENAVTHKLIVGENYDALKNLLIQYRGKVDVIYIDPPYGKDKMGEFAETNYNNAISRDNLLTMLELRLNVAKWLLSDTGVIFCSIDDRNQAYVKCLFDEIFGEENFISNIVRKTKSFDRDKSNRNLQKLFDYVLFYAKNLESVDLLQDCVGERIYPLEDAHGKYKLNPLQNTGPHGYRDLRPKTYFPIYQLKNGTYAVDEPKDSNEINEVFLPKKIGTRDGCWSWQKTTILENNDRIVEKNSKLFIKIYKDDNKDNNKYRSKENLLLNFLNASGSSTLTSLGIQDTFANPKPVELIKWCVSLQDNKSSIVLDFFAGSGTTGQAVAELNKEDGGNRQFILVQMDEKTATTPNGIVKDVTSKRLKRVMTGECYDGSKDFDWIKKNSPLGGNLDVYNIEKVNPKVNKNGKSIIDVIDETLYGKEKCKTLKEKVDWVCANFDNAERIKGKED